MEEKYLEAVRFIKAAILKSQYQAARYVNSEQLSLYYAIGAYVSANSRKGTWGTGAIKEISTRLQEELPGLRGFSDANIKLMRQFYEEWSPLLVGFTEADQTGKSLTAVSDLSIVQIFLPESDKNRTQVMNDFNMKYFTSIGFSLHMMIIRKAKDIDERMFYIREAAIGHWSRNMLEIRLKEDLYHHRGSMQNNFEITIPENKQYLKAIQSFKDEYLLDFVNIEELDLSDPQDLDERVLEGEIVRNIRNFIQCLGSGFCFIGNQHRIVVNGDEFFCDLLFFQRDLKALVVVELKKGKFKPAYLGQLNFYLTALDEQERKNGENPSIGILMCKEVNRGVVEMAIRDYSKPLGVATYRTADELPGNYKVLAPILEEVPKLLEISAMPEKPTD